LHKKNPFMDGQRLAPQHKAEHSVSNHEGQEENEGLENKGPVLRFSLTRTGPTVSRHGVRSGREHRPVPERGRMLYFQRR